MKPDSLFFSFEILRFLEFFYRISLLLYAHSSSFYRIPAWRWISAKRFPLVCLLRSPACCLPRFTFLLLSSPILSSFAIFSNSLLSLAVFSDSPPRLLIRTSSLILFGNSLFHHHAICLSIWPTIRCGSRKLISTPIN